VIQRLCRDKDCVIHLAGVHADDLKPATLYREINTLGTLNVCDAAAAAGVERLIYLSSTEVYGLQRGEVTEDSPLRPVGPHARSIREAEQMCNRWRMQDRERRRLLTVRSAPLFGEGTRGNVYHLIREVARGHFWMIGGGKNRKSLAYIENLAEFLAHMVKQGFETRVINYADKPDLDMAQVVDVIRETMGLGSRVRHIPYLLAWLGATGLDLYACLVRKKFGITRERVVKFGLETRFSAQRVHATGFKAPFTIEEGLQRTVEADFQTTLLRKREAER
jgi:nucleoside-diphosphate-sugar epimerase